MFRSDWMHEFVVFVGFPGQFIPAEKVHEKLFVGSQREFKKPTFPAVSRYNRKRSAEEVQTMTKRLLHKESKLRKKLLEQGIDYDFPGFVRVSDLNHKPLKYAGLIMFSI